MVLAFCAISARGQALHADGILATVGDKIILRSDFENEWAQLTRSQLVTDTGFSRCAVFKKLLVQKLMLNQAEIDSLPLTDDKIESEIENRLRYYQRQAGSQAELERYLGKSIIQYKEDIRPKMREQLLAQEMTSKIVSGMKISPQEVKQYFEKIPADSLPIIPTEVEVGQLLIEPPISEAAREYARMQLENIRLRILSGESFEKLAKIYSEDPGSKVEGGLLPEFGRGEMVPQFETMAFKLKPDSVSQVFESDYGFHIMKLISRKGERILARHILIKPPSTAADYEKAAAQIDSAYILYTSGQMNWCDIVKKYNNSELNNKGYCGFLTDEQSGGQKILYEALPPETKKAIETLKPGDVSKPTFTRTADDKRVYYIVYLKSFDAPHRANLSQDYSKIQAEAEADKKEEMVETWIMKTLKTTYLKINNKAFINCTELNGWENLN
jgi:peptidyl-prolyl cis-trans isomerase SurA